MSVGNMWFRSGNNTWCCLCNGKQKTLAKGKDNIEAAKLAYANLIRKDAEVAIPVGTPSDETACSAILEMWLAHKEGKVTPATHRRSKDYISSFCKVNGEITIKDMKNRHFTSWMDNETNWSSSTKNAACKCISAALNWAMIEEYISRNPAKIVQKPRAEARGAEAIILPEEAEKLLAAAPAYLKDMLHALASTGCRPSELLTVTASNFDPAARCWVLGNHKTYAKVGVRHIVLIPSMIEMCERLAAKYPTGPLFRGSRGQVYVARNLAESVHRLCKTVGITRQIIPYFFRHSFAFGLLKKDMSDSKVAALLGHTSTKYVSANYGHMLERVAGLADDLGNILQ